MHKCKTVSTPLGEHFKLLNSRCSSIDEEVEHMERISYTSGVGSVMYAMV